VVLTVIFSELAVSRVQAEGYTGVLAKEVLPASRKVIQVAKGREIAAVQKSRKPIRESRRGFFLQQEGKNLFLKPAR